MEAEIEWFFGVELDAPVAREVSGVDGQSVVELFCFDVFVGAMGLGNVSGAKDGCGDVEMCKCAGVGGVRYADGLIAVSVRQRGLEQSAHQRMGGIGRHGSIFGKGLDADGQVSYESI